MKDQYPDHNLLWRGISRGLLIVLPFWLFMVWALLS